MKICNYVLGQSVYHHDNGKFLGYFLNELTDDLPHDTPQNNSEYWKKQKPIGFYRPNKIIKTPFYHKREVYSYCFGTVTQILITSLNDSFVWINVNYYDKLVLNHN